MSRFPSLGGVALAFLAACGCENQGDWSRHFTVSIVGITPEEVGSGSVEVLREDGSVRFACAVQFVREGGEGLTEEEDCTEDVLGTTYVDSSREWLNTWRLQRRFNTGSVAVQLFDPEGEPVEDWETPAFPFWAGTFGHQLTCGDVQGNIVLDRFGDYAGLP